MNDITQWYAVCVVVLFLKMFAISLYQAYHRIGKNAYSTPEDARFARVSALPEELPEVQRGAKAWRNDVENIPVFFALGFAYMAVNAPQEIGIWLFAIFTVARILHTISYLLALQPWRSLVYAVGVICLFGLSFEIVAVIF